MGLINFMDINQKNDKNQSADELYEDIGKPKFEKSEKKRPGILITIITAVIFGMLAGAVGYLVIAFRVFDLPFLERYLSTLNSNSQKTQIISRKASDNRESINNLVNKIRPQIVTIYLSKSDSQEELSKIYKDEEIIGYGAILSSDGWIITNQEVISDIEKNYVIVTDRKEIFNVEKIVADPLTNSIFLKTSAENLTPIEFAAPDEFYLTEEVFLLAPRSAQGQNLFTGVIQNLNYQKNEGLTSYIFSSDQIVSYLLLNDFPEAYFSGTALFNLDQKIVGFSGNSIDGKINVFVPAYYLESLLPSLLKKGEVSRPYLGIHYLDISQTLNLSSNLSQNLKKGLLIKGEGDKKAIIESSPALQSGLEEDDIIIKINDVEIDNAEQFNRLISESAPGKKLDFLVKRAQGDKLITVTLGKL